MESYYRTFEEAEMSLAENQNLKNKEIIDSATNKKHVISSMIIFPNIYFENGREIKNGYDIAVFFKNEMSFVLLKEITGRFSIYVKPKQFITSIILTDKSTL